MTEKNPEYSTNVGKLLHDLTLATASYLRAKERFLTLMANKLMVSGLHPYPKEEFAMEVEKAKAKHIKFLLSLCVESPNFALRIADPEFKNNGFPMELSLCSSGNVQAPKNSEA